MKLVGVELPDNNALTSKMEMDYNGLGAMDYSTYNKSGNFKICNGTAFLEKVILNKYS